MESSRLPCAALAVLLSMLALQEAGLHLPPSTASATTQPPPPRTARRHVKNMVFYMHDLPTANQPTAVPVAAQNGRLGQPFKLGLTFVFDDKLTDGPDPNSTEIGRGQGVYAFASLTSPDLLLIFTAVLHDGSTICLHGSDRIALPEREIGIVSGTGIFRLARGYAILSTVSVDGLNAIIKFNLTMLL